MNFFFKDVKKNILKNLGFKVPIWSYLSCYQGLKNTGRTPTFQDTFLTRLTS